MEITKLNPWNWFRKEDEQDKVLPVKQQGRGEAHPAANPLVGIHTEVDRIFDQAFHNFGLSPSFFGANSLFAKGTDAFRPKVDIGGSEKEYTITAELPGINEKDISIELKGDALIISGEKKQEEKTEEKGYYRVERSYGSFQRMLNVPDDADTENIKAKYKNGVITIVLPRTKNIESETRKIAIE